MSTRVNSQSLRKRITNGLEEGFAPSPRRFTVEEYYKMAEAGVLGQDERVELIEGEIIVMSPQGPRHASSSSLATKWFVLHCSDRCTVRIQLPIHLDNSSEPEPDVVLAVLDEDDYGDHHPAPKEILMVMEVSDSTLEFDRVRKSRTYAKAGIGQYCLLNVQSRELEDYRHPSEDGYRSKQTYSVDESFKLAAFPSISVNVADLLPPLKRAGKFKKRSK